MDTNTVEKFASLFANCAVKNNTDELRKEAADHGLVKAAEGVTDLLLQNAPWLLPVIGTAGGAAAGYIGTKDEKRKKRNALYGALTGGLLGSGGALMSYGSGITSDATKKMREANQERNDTVAATAPSGTWRQTADGKRTWLGALAENTPGIEGFFMGADHPFNPLTGTYGLNAYNVPARLGVGGLGARIGGALGSRFVDRPTRQQIFDAVDAANKPAPAPKQNRRGQTPPPPPPNWTLDETKNVLNAISSRADAPVRTFGDRLSRITGAIPVPGLRRDRYTDAALAEMGATPFTGWRPFLNNIVNSVRNPRGGGANWSNWLAARNRAMDTLRDARVLGESARNRTLPTTSTGQERLIRGVESVLTNPAGPARAAPGTAASPPPPLPARPSPFSGAAAPRPAASQLPAETPRSRMPNRTELRTAVEEAVREKGRGTGGRRAGRAAGGVAGLAMSNPATVRAILNYLVGSQMVTPPKDTPKNTEQ